MPPKDQKPVDAPEKKPLVGDMTVDEFNRALSEHANDIKTHISDALKHILNDYPKIKEELGFIIAALYDIKNGI